MTKKQRKFVEHGGQARILAGIGLRFMMLVAPVIAVALFAFIGFEMFHSAKGLALAGIPVISMGRPESIADVTVPNLDTPYNLPTQGGLLPNDRYLYGLRFHAAFRTTNPAANFPTGTQADAPWSIFERIQVSGTHRIRGVQETFIDIRGAELHEYNVYWYGRQPLNLPASIGTGANTVNDFRLFLELPFVPENMPWWEKVKYLLDAPNYDNLKLTIIVGSDKSIFTGQTTAPTFSGFGGTGTFTIFVSGYYALGGKAQFEGFVPARVWRTFIENISTDLTSSNSGTRLFNPNRGYALRSLLLKTGVKSGAVNAGENVYNTLSNSILNNVKVMRGIGRQIRHYRTFFEAQQDAAKSYDLAVQPDAGYALVDFANSQFLGEALNTKPYVAGPTGDVDLFVQADVTGAANQGAVLVMEELREKPIIIKSAA